MGGVTDDSVMEALDAVTDADRDWFLAHPKRGYHLRPLQIDEILPGETAVPGTYVIVVKLGEPMVGRLRLPIVRPPHHLRLDTDRCCAELVAQCDWELNGEPMSKLVPKLQALFADAFPS